MRFNIFYHICFAHFNAEKLPLATSAAYYPLTLISYCKTAGGIRESVPDMYSTR